MAASFLIPGDPLFDDRRDAGRELAASLEAERRPGLIVVGLARGGMETAAEVARALDARLDVVAVRKIGHPWQPEYAIGAVTPDRGVFLRDTSGLDEQELARVVEETKTKATTLDRRLHADYPAADLDGETVVLVDDGLATGATMVAAVRWARAAGAARVVAAVPVAAARSLELIQREADAVACPHALENFFAVGSWYRRFPQLDDEAVIQLLAENRRARAPLAFAAGGQGT